MAAKASRACSTCRGIFVNRDFPSYYTDQAYRLTTQGADGTSIWFKHANELRTSISQGCSMCKALEDCFQQNKLNSKLYTDTGDIKLNIMYFRLDYYPIHLAFSTNDPEEEYKGRKDWLCYTLAAASEADPSFKVVTENPMQRFVASDSHFNMVQGWIKTCRDDHKCHADISQFTPTRLIDVSPKDQQVEARLISGHGITAPYAALSYCWGNANSTTTKANLHAMQECLQIKELAKTIQDAITCTRRLEIRYLWIDALCIVQDADEEKAQEIASMGRIYANAEVTICVAQARNATEGFLHEREFACAVPGEIIPYLPFHCGGGVVGAVGLLKHTPTTFRDPLTYRGWAFQEQMLSRRSVVYGTLGLYWHCLERQEPQWIMKRPPERLSQGWLLGYYQELHGGWELSTRKTNIRVTKMRCWEKFVEEYSRRVLSNWSDRLPAISAVATKLGEPASGYAAGLWLSALASQLRWVSTDYTGSYRFRNLAPSWSWASLRGPITFDDAVPYDLRDDQRHSDGPFPVAEVAFCESVPKYHFAPFGMINSCRLSLKGQLRHISVDTTWSTEPGWRDPQKKASTTQYLDSKIECEQINGPFFSMGVVEMQGYVVSLLLHRPEVRYRRFGIRIEPARNYESEEWSKVPTEIVELE